MKFPTRFHLNYPAQVGLDNAKDDQHDAGHGPADSDAEYDTEKGPNIFQHKQNEGRLMFIKRLLLKTKNYCNCLQSTETSGV
jgi:hypothetical protein